MPLSPLLSPVPFEALPGWQADAHAEAFRAFRRCALHALRSPYKSGALGLEATSFVPAFEEAADRELDADPARTFFQKHFTPFAVKPDDRPRGFVTGFYEPVVAASPVRTGRFGVPLLETPDDLVKIDDGNRPAGLDPYLAFGRHTDGGGIVEYHDRAAIERGAIKGPARAIAWLEYPVDAFFVHVQGSARLELPDGSTRRVSYAAKSGQRFTGPGGVLVELGEIPHEKVTMQSIRAWFRDNPHRIDEILHRNRSYIFFREAPVDDPALGPVAAAKVPLAPGRSIAVDRLLHTFATPVFVDAPSLAAFGAAPFRRLMIAQDTGSAIVGPARGDLFAGSGDAAGEIAGVVRADADFYVLVPRALAGGGR